MVNQTELKKRRGRYSTRLPEPQASHGFVRDLVSELERVAKEFKLDLGVYKKNHDYYLSILVPNVAELDAMDRSSAPVPGAKETEA